MRRSPLGFCAAGIVIMLAVAPAFGDDLFVFNFAYGPGCD